MTRRVSEEKVMSASITVEEAQAHLKEIISQLAPGDEVIITEHQQPIAKLVAARPAERKLGTMRGTVRYMAPDFDAPLEDFKEYME
jgi:antitoxin (DNA-binding transcriptional repressor) of toxin-antitoxin stability system